METLRTATIADIPRLVELGRMMHFESRYAVFDFDPATVAVTLREAIAQGLTFLVEQDGDLVGGFVGVITTHFFGRDRIAYDVATYVAPAHRGRLGVRMIREYVRRAKAAGVVDIHLGTSSGIQPERMERLCARLGFTRIGGLYAIGA